MGNTKQGMDEGRAMASAAATSLLLFTIHRLPMEAGQQSRHLLDRRERFVAAWQVAKIGGYQHLCFELAERPFRHIQELSKLLAAASCCTLRDVTGNRDCSSAHLCDEAKHFLPGKRLCRGVNEPHQPHCFAPCLQVLVRAGHNGFSYSLFPISYFLLVDSRPP